MFMEFNSVADICALYPSKTSACPSAHFFYVSPQTSKTFHPKNEEYKKIVYFTTFPLKKVLNTSRTKLNFYIFQVKIKENVSCV
jgi:hypothetical protein